MPVSFMLKVSMTTIVNPILQMFREALDAMYGDRIERVVLYGSQARGDARPDSDYDVAVFLKAFSDRWAELDRLARRASNFLMKPALSSMRNPTWPPRDAAAGQTKLHGVYAQHRWPAHGPEEIRHLQTTGY